MKVHDPVYTVTRDCRTCTGKGWVLAPSGFYAGEPVKCGACGGQPLEMEVRETGKRIRKVVGFDALMLVRSGKVTA